VTQSTIALTIGDPNGIGPEIAVKAAAKLAREGGPAVVLVGDEFVVRFYADLCAKDLTIRSFDGVGPGPSSLRLLAVDALPREAFRPGTPLAAGGRATLDHVAAAIRLVNDGHAAAIVACPHSKTSVNAAGIPFSGYPSLLARLMNVPEDEVFLMLVGGGPRIVHVTLHERLHTALGQDHVRIDRAGDADRRRGSAEAEHRAAAHRIVRHQSPRRRGRLIGGRR
jgi:4-hydroxy-L-threonine phosphate dehydrogenase PdxA